MFLPWAALAHGIVWLFSTLPSFIWVSVQQSDIEFDWSLGTRNASLNSYLLYSVVPLNELKVFSPSYLKNVLWLSGTRSTLVSHVEYKSTLSFEEKNDTCSIHRLTEITWMKQWLRCSWHWGRDIEGKNLSL